MALFLLAAQHVLSTCRVRVAILCAITGLCLQTASPTAEEQGVTWTEVVNATVSGTILQKTGGLDGVADAGAVSMQDISAGDGRYFLWTTNLGGDRLDALLVKIPAERFSGR